MTNLTETKTATRINWTIEGNNLNVVFPTGEKCTFDFTTIKDYVEISNPIQNELFLYGLKKKIVDTVAGAAKNGISVKDQIETMTEKFEEIRTGVVKVRKNAKIDPLAEARAKLAAMPEGKEKEAAMKFAVLLGIVK